MDLFYTYLQLGFEHIADLQGFDHIVFLIALCAVYQPYQWKNLLVLVSAFTIGHSVTLALSALNIFVMPSDLVEFLIPVTIFLTCIYNIFENTEKISHRKMNFNYLLAFLFGLIHGMGFSNYFRMIFSESSEMILPLFSFNIGLEIGQLMIVSIILIIMFIMLKVFKVKFRDWLLFVSGLAAGISLLLMQNTVFW